METKGKNQLEVLSSQVEYYDQLVQAYKDADNINLTVEELQVIEGLIQQLEESLCDLGIQIPFK